MRERPHQQNVARLFRGEAFSAAVQIPRQGTDSSVPTQSHIRAVFSRWGAHFIAAPASGALPGITAASCFLAPQPAPSRFS